MREAGVRLTPQIGTLWRRRGLPEARRKQVASHSGAGLASLLQSRLPGGLLLKFCRHPEGPRQLLTSQSTWGM